MSVDAVIFDWGGTLTPWKDMDGRAWWRITEGLAQVGTVSAHEVETLAATFSAAEEALWQRARREHRSGSLTEVLAAGGLTPDDQFYELHDAEHTWATYTDPEAVPLLTGLRERGIRVGVLSNTSWSREQHERIFVRDGVADLIDGAVYTSEIEWTKPHPEAFQAAMVAVGVSDPARCVFVGDRPFDDIFGAHQAGMRAVLVPHSRIPDVQRGHTEDAPDAVIHRLGELLPIIDSWRSVDQTDRPT